jgi:hypothetical protein
LSVRFLATADVIELYLGHPAFAVIAVGLAVAATDRLKLTRAEGRRLVASAWRLGNGALTLGLLAPQRRIAGDRVLATTGFVEICRRGAD